MGEGSAPDPANAGEDRAREDLLAQIAGAFGNALIDSHISVGHDLCIRVSHESWEPLAKFLRTGLGFGYFSFLSAIDWMPSPFGRDMDSQVDLSVAAGADPADGASSDSDPTDGAGSDSDPTDGPGSETVPANAGESRVTGVAGGDTRFQVLARVNDVVGHRSLSCKVDLPDDNLSIATWVNEYPGANWHEREAWEMFGIEFVGHPGLRHLYLPGAFEGHPLRKDYPLLARRVKPWPGIVDVELMPGDDDEAES